MRLQDKFKRVFILPLICGILLSIILTVLILILYSKYFSDNNLIDRLQTIELGKSNPIIYTANNLIFKKFQKSIYALQLMRKYYRFYADSIKKGYTKFDSKLINSHVTNSLKINENYKEFVKVLENEGENNSTYLDHAFWHYDNHVSDYNKLSDNFKQQLLVLTHMIPVFRSIYETSKNSLSNRFDLIYFANKKSNLFYGYPIYNNNPDFFSIFKKITNYPSCKTPSGSQPDYYYFFCRDWWLQVVEATINPQQNDIIITTPYKFQGIKKYGITVCIKFDDLFVPEYDLDKSNALSSICIDTEINDLIETFDHFNKELAGYFYVLRVNSDIPIYYPMILRNDYFSNLARLEFDIETPYFVEELADFNDNTKPMLIKKYDDVNVNLMDRQKLGSAYQGNYQKNGLASNYTIYPVKLFTDENNFNDAWHIITIVFISQPLTLKNSLQSFESYLYPRLIIQIFLFAIMGGILVLISWYLIISIALNIVKPIKNLKYLIQGMNVNSETVDLNPDNKLSNNKYKKNNQNITSSFKKNLQNESSDFYDVNEESKNNENSKEPIEYDEETLEMRSAEMDKLFNILLKLKNVLSFTTNSKTVFDKNALVNYVNAKYTFNEVSNLKGKNVCDSNVGNLSIRCQKYDKAIFHLIESMPEEKKNLVYARTANDNIAKNMNDYLNEIQNNFHTNFTKKVSRISKMNKNKNSVNNIYSSNNTHKDKEKEKDKENSIGNITSTQNNGANNNNILETNPGVNQKVSSNSIINNFPNSNLNKNEFKKRDLNQMVVIESRYPKLLYAYKKMFKSFRKMFKKISNSEDEKQDRHTINQKMMEELIKMDIYVIKERHSLEANENFLIDYMKESASIGDNRRTAEAILEYIEFLIIYKLKPDNELGIYFDLNLNTYKSEIDNSNTNNLTDNNPLNQIQQNKLEVLEEIGKYFKNFDIIYDILRQSCSSEYFKTFLDLLRNNRKENLEIIETPFLVLYQRSNYLKGKLAKICGHYDKALEFFHRSRETLIICDASLIKKSINQIVKIMKFLKVEVDKELQFYETSEKLLNLSDIKDKDNNSSMQVSTRHNTIGMKDTNNTMTAQGKKIREKLEDLKEKSKEIETYINNNIDQLSSFNYIPKDLVILIDVSNKMMSDSKKIERSLKTANNFLDLYITNEDRFGLFVYSSNINPIISLTEKNYNTYFCVRNLIEGMLNDPPNFGLGTGINNNVNIEKTENSNTCRAISLAYDYIKKKNPDPKTREKWIIVFTDSFKPENNPDLKIFSDLKNIRETTKEQINVIVVGINMESEETKRIKESLENLSKKSHYIDFDNISIFANILKVNGQIKPEIEFPNERYESDKVKRL